MNDIEQQIVDKQQKKQKIINLRAETNSCTYDYGYYQGMIDLLGQQIAELRRKQDKRK